MEKLQELKSKIHELLPELLDLKFGCEVKTVGFWPRILGNEEVIEDGKEQFIDWGGGNTYKVEKILGSKIGIAEVLRAYAEPLKKLGYSQAVIMGTSEVKKLLNFWNFAKGNIDEQSPDTISFLHNLIC